MYFDRGNFYDFTSLVILIYGLFIFDRFSFRILLIKCRHLQGMNPFFMYCYDLVLILDIIFLDYVDS
ncbi:hypothetical protein HanPSC8_Chr09g0385931 [Helianthus annuus]|nr:hypothetical protein HanPSC8_Chr13g0574091 [Helianthus annuus]KAJ0894158.1 hypothetical protein HanPSC8_Chr09g0385931 [Helianthus annuus]